MIVASIKLEAACDEETELRLVERTARTVSECLGRPIHEVMVLINPSAWLGPQGGSTQGSPSIDTSNPAVAEATAKLLAN